MELYVILIILLSCTATNIPQQEAGITVSARWTWLKPLMHNVVKWPNKL